MAKVLCVLYDDPVDGYPESYARDAIPTIERYYDGQTTPSPEGIDFRPGELLGSVSALRQRTLPAVGGDVLVRSLDVAWPEIRVRGFDVTAFTRGEEGSVEWLSHDGGASWTVTRR